MITLLLLNYYVLQPKQSSSYTAFDWACVQGSSVVQREQNEYDVKKKHQKLQFCLPKYLCRALI